MAVAYVSLYRSYRPQTFDEVVGQRHVIDTLRNAIRGDRLHHAYLFAGPRGTGKTTIARILAMAVNATGGPTADPDPADPVSVAIREGSAVDVVELDMASHGGVDDARELRERARFAPAQLRRKVYILDEVHMASPAAFNALLKLIEEPPNHVLFAMATTDPQKVLPTILSRVQRLDLRRVAADAVGAHVRTISEREGHTIDDGAVAAVTRAGDGSVRDTLSVLEQVLAHAGRSDGAGNAVTTEAVADSLGLTPLDRCFEAVDHVAAGDLAATFSLTQRLLDDGHALRRFALDLVRHVRDLLVVQVAPGEPSLVAGTDTHRERVAEQAGRVPRETLLRAMTLLSDTLVEMREGPPRLPLELALAQLASPATTSPDAAKDVSALVDRIARLETALANGGGTAARAPKGRPPGPAVPVVAIPEPPSTKSATRVAQAEADGATEGTSRPDATDEHSDDEQDASAAAAGVSTPDRSSPGDPAPPSSGSGAAEAGSPAVVSTRPDTGDRSVPAGGESSTVVDPEGGAGGAATGAPSATEARHAGDRLAVVTAAWPEILEHLKGSSRKVHAVFTPGTPVAVTNSDLVLEYGERHARFHAVEAPKASYVTALKAAMQELVGFTVGVRTRIEGDAPTRPRPPAVDGGSAAAAEPPTTTGGTGAPTSGDGDHHGDVGSSASAVATAARQTTDEHPDMPPMAPPPGAAPPGTGSPGASEAADAQPGVAPAVAATPARPVDEVDDVRQAEADVEDGAARTITLDDVDELLRRELQAIELTDD